MSIPYGLFCNNPGCEGFAGCSVEAEPAAHNEAGVLDVVVQCHTCMKKLNAFVDWTHLNEIPC